MKIQKLVLKAHPFFRDKKIEFVGLEGKVLDTVVFAGNNGSGKTTMLKVIFDLLTKEYEASDDFSSVDLNVQSLVASNLMTPSLFSEQGNHIIKKIRGISFSDRFHTIDEARRPKIVYMPAEIQFDDLNVKERSYKYKYSFDNIVDKQMVRDVPTYISSLIKDEIFKNIKLPAETSINKVCEEINTIFRDLEINAEMTGLAEEGEKLPVFRNDSGTVFDINGLSSGEKQLFIRALSLKMINVNNSVILIDEPEISLHPKWQQKILRTYQSIGSNNQVIVATHSPHILSSVRAESVFLLSKENGESVIYNYQDKDSIYGKPIEIVLKDFMGLESDRDPKTALLIEEVRELVRNDMYGAEEFSDKFTKLRGIVGDIDQDLILLKMDIARRKAKRGGSDAEHKES